MNIPFFQPLTILEEFLILAHDDQAGQFYPLARSAFDAAAAGAVLMDLTLQHRIDNDLKNLFVIDPTPVNDEILDPVLQFVALAPIMQPLPITHWVRQLAGEGEALREKALRRLEERGILKREAKKILWIFKADYYPIQHEPKVREVRQRLRGIILEDELPLSHDIMLVALAEACGLFRHIFGGKESAQVLPRIEQVARMDLIGQAVAKSVAEIETAIAMASGFR